MDMTTHTLTAGLAAAPRQLVGDLLEYTTHLNAIGNGANNIHLQVEPDHTPEGLGFTVRQRPGPLGHLLEFIHVAHADDKLGSLSFSARSTATGGTEFTLTERGPRGASPQTQSWDGSTPLDTIREKVEDAVFTWILVASHPATPQPLVAPFLP